SPSKMVLFQTLSWYWKTSCAITSAISVAVISQATFQLFGADQKPRAVAQKRRTSGLPLCPSAVARSASFDIKTSIPTVTYARPPQPNAAKFQKFSLCPEDGMRVRCRWVLGRALSRRISSAARSVDLESEALGSDALGGEMTMARGKNSKPGCQDNRLFGVAACLKAVAWPAVFLVLGIYYGIPPLSLLTVLKGWEAILR